MTACNKVRGTMDTVQDIEVNVDTVYIRSNIVALNVEGFKGWEYDEVQYDKNEYIGILQAQLNTTQKMSARSNTDFQSFMDYAFEKIPNLSE